MLYTKIYRMYTKGAKGHNLIGRGQPKDKYSLTKNPLNLQNQ